MFRSFEATAGGGRETLPQGRKRLARWTGSTGPGAFARRRPPCETKEPEKKKEQSLINSYDTTHALRNIHCTVTPVV